MSDKHQALVLLNKEFHRWQDLLSTLSEAQITAPHLPANLSIKDVVAHLMAWQQVSIARLKAARLEAARLDTEPVFPDWLAGEDPGIGGAPRHVQRQDLCHLSPAALALGLSGLAGWLWRFFALGGADPRTGSLGCGEIPLAERLSPPGRAPGLL